MSNRNHDIQAYLSELKLAMQGQSAALIQDALYDTQSHLHEAMLEDDAPDISALLADYGSPADIAAHYIKLENESQQFIQGPTGTAPRFNGFFEPLSRLNDYKSLAYFFIALPLSIAYFAWLVLAGVPILALSVLVVGVPLLALFLKVQSQLALFEGQLINALLGTRMPRRPANKPSSTLANHTITQAISSAIKAPLGWKTSFYSLIHLPLSATYFCLGSLLFVASVAVILSPVVDPIIHYFIPELTVDIQWYWFPVTTLVGVVGMTLSLHIVHALKKLHSGIASYLLIQR